MKLEEHAARLGFEYKAVKRLAQTDTGVHYTRLEHQLTSTTDTTKPPFVFRDRATVQLFLDDKSQLELIREGHQKGQKRT